MRWAALIAAVAGTICVPAISRSANYVPPVEKETTSPPQALFGKVKRTGRWCAFNLADWKLRNDHEDFDPDESGWIRYSGSTLESITVASQSEDAYTEDRYFFGSEGRVVRMVRTGHYISAPWASFEYRPGRNGRLALTAASRKVALRLGKEAETYIVDWPRYLSLRQMPFATLIDLSGGVRVNLTCLERKHPDP